MAEVEESFNELLQSEERPEKVGSRFTIFDESVALGEDYNENILNLPDEMILEIFKFLTLCDRRNCTLVCKKFRKLSFDSSLWREIALYLMKIDITSLERILNCGVRSFYLKFSKINVEMTLIPSFFISTRFESLQHLDIRSTSIKSDLLENLLTLTQQLKSIVLFGACEITNSILKTLLNLKFLESLEVNKVESLEVDHDILNILEKGRKRTNLKKFSFKIDNIPDDTFDVFKMFLENLFKLSPNIVSLNLGKNIKIEGGTLRYILNMLHMEELSVATNLSVLSNEDSRILSNHVILHKLREVNFFGTNFRILPRFFKYLPNLESVDLEDCFIPEAVFGQLTSLEYLKNVQFWKCSFEASLEIYDNFVSSECSLRSTFLYYCDGLNSNVLSTWLLRCSCLRSFHISNAIVNFSIFRSLLYLKRLESLEMWYFKLQFSNDCFIDSKDWNMFQLQTLCLREIVEVEEISLVLSFCLNITTLRLCRSVITPHIVQCIMRIKNLETLKLYKVREDSFESVGNTHSQVLGELTKFSFAYKEFQTTPRLLEFLCPAVICAKEIRLENFTITETIYRCILKMGELDSLKLLNVSGVTSECIPEFLENCLKLRENSIRICLKKNI